MGYTADEDARSLDDHEIAKEFRQLKILLYPALAGEPLTVADERFAEAHVKRLNTALELMGEKL